MYDLYREAHMPWAWQPRLQQVAHDVGLDFFSTPFDETAVAFLEELAVPVYKIASPELVDLPLIRRVAATGRPMMLSTGMASEAEIDAALAAAREAGGEQIALLKCTTAYPAPAHEMNLRTIPAMRDRFGVVVGLSDHTMTTDAAVVAVALGGCVIEKHLTLSRATPGPDSTFSLEPAEFAQMVQAVRGAEAALGEARYGPSPSERQSIPYRRSLFVVRDVRAGDIFTAESVRSIRPGHGLPPRHLTEVLGRRAATDIGAGTPLAWELIERTP